jgi:Na+/melibiose symporter-like transporter
LSDIYQIDITPDGVNFLIILGQRTPWYVFGLVLVFVCYIPIYQDFHSENGWDYAYYTIFPGLFNVGWAALQISHMSLVPSLTCSRKRRVKDLFI